MARQLALEDEIFAQQSEGAVVFLDRSLIDIFGYAEHTGKKLSAGMQAALRQRQDERYHLQAFFILALAQGVEQNDFRHEARAEAVQIGDLLRRHYQKEGFTMIDVPEATIEERAQFILSRLDFKTSK